VNRRKFVSSAIVLAILSFAAKAQQTGPRHIGVLLVAFPPKGKEAQAFRDGLRDTGYTEGRELVSVGIQ